jgi:L-fucose isomerase-like protein
MHALSLAAMKPGALLDWNNNFGSSLDKSIVFHCSNIPKSFLNNDARHTFNPVSANAVGLDISYGTVFGAMKPQKVTFCRISTDDYSGNIKAYFGEGEITNDIAKTFGGYGIMYVPNLQHLLKYICKNGFEHHVAVAEGSVVRIIEEALGNYAGFETYLHS